MLLPYRNGFDLANLSMRYGAVQEDQARNIILVLDTLKKFVNLMDKTEGTKFGKVARQFTQAGGTLIGLAHTNKHRDEEGKSVYSGTTDIADDCYCVYLVELLDDNRVSGKRVIQFRNEKRGDVALEKSFSYIEKRESLMRTCLIAYRSLTRKTRSKKRASEKEKTIFCGQL